MGVPGADDIMLNYQSTSFHDALYLRRLLRLGRAPEFEAWLHDLQLTDDRGDLLPVTAAHPALRQMRLLSRTS
jgi:ethanolamine ammonia-lyase large subunit